jgi:ubiquinone/menaquinone biosynthesis C-methylase UbiE
MTLPFNSAQAPTFPELYERILVGPLFKPFAEELLERVKLAPGDTVLDIACGTGIVSRLAKEKLGATGKVTGVDLSPPMLAVARTIAPDIDWRTGSASSMPVDAGAFSVVICQQGLQFFPEKPSAAAEMRRALAPGGRVAVATWRSRDENVLFDALTRVAERHVGPVVDQRHSYADAGVLASLLTAAGLRDVRVETVTRTVRVPEGAMLARMNSMAIVSMSAAGGEMSDEERPKVVGAIAAECAEVLSRYADGGGIAFDMSTNVATATA